MSPTPKFSGTRNGWMKQKVQVRRTMDIRYGHVRFVASCPEDVQSGHLLHVSFKPQFTWARRGVQQVLVGVMEMHTGS